MSIRQYSRVEVLRDRYKLPLQSRTGIVVWGDIYNMYVVRLDQAALGTDVYGQPTWYKEIREPEGNLRIIKEPPGE